MMSRQAAESRVTVQKALVIDAYEIICIAICTVKLQQPSDDDVRKILPFNFSSPSESARGQKSKGSAVKKFDRTRIIKLLLYYFCTSGSRDRSNWTDRLLDCGHQDRQSGIRSWLDSRKSSIGDAVSLSVGRVSRPVVVAVNHCVRHTGAGGWSWSAVREKHCSSRLELEECEKKIL